MPRIDRDFLKGLQPLAGPGAFLSLLKSRGLLWPAVWALAGVAVLVSLGNWQLERLDWKQGLIGSIAERTRAEPVSLDEVERRAEEGADVEYTRVKVAGRFEDSELHFYAVDQRYGPGYHVVAPLRLPDGSAVFVNRGYVPQDLKDPAKRRLQAGEVEVVGLVRSGQRQGLFTPPNDRVKNIWYWRDLPAMAEAALGPGDRRVHGFVVEAEATPGDDWPKGGVTRLDLPNRHFEYALTWYGLAAALAAVFAAFAVTRLKGPPPRRRP